MVKLCSKRGIYLVVLRDDDDLDLGGVAVDRLHCERDRADIERGENTNNLENRIFFDNSRLPTLSSTCTVNVKYPSMELVGVKAAVMMPVL